jgi:hypothetical protein
MKSSCHSRNIDHISHRSFQLNILSLCFLFYLLKISLNLLVRIVLKCKLEKNIHIYPIKLPHNCQCASQTTKLPIVSMSLLNY